MKFSAIYSFNGRHERYARIEGTITCNINNEEFFIYLSLNIHHSSQFLYLNVLNVCIDEDASSTL